MPTFSYLAIRRASGAEEAGHIEEPSRERAIEALRERGLLPMALDESGRDPGRRGPGVSAGAGDLEAGGGWRGSAARLRLFGRPRFKPRELAVMTRQLATLLAAGLPILRSLETLEKQARSVGARSLLGDLAATVRAGGSFSSALEKHPKSFDRLYVNMVRAGEASGGLGEVLQRSAQFLEKQSRLKGRVTAALAYPTVLSVVAVSIVAALTTWVVPKFEQIFLSQLKGRPLPALTRAVLDVSTAVSEHGGGLVLGGGLLGVAIVWARRQAWGHRARDWASLRLPGVSGVTVRVTLARLTRTLGTLLAAGVSVLEAIRLTQQATLHLEFIRLLGELRDHVERGGAIAASLSRSPWMPPLVPALVEVGEATGQLPEMLVKVADIYDEEVDVAVTSFAALLEPIMIVVMALVVGVIVIALFLPMVEIIKGLAG